MYSLQSFIGGFGVKKGVRDVDLKVLAALMTSGKISAMLRK